MPLLPRSRRGTWLLAAAVWCAACVGWWYVLPVVPLAVLQFPFESDLLGFAPDGESVLVQRFTVKLDGLPFVYESQKDLSKLESLRNLARAQGQLGYIVRVQELATVQIATGLTATIHENTATPFDRYTESKDRRFWLLGSRSNPKAPLYRFDLSTHALEPQPDLAQALEVSKYQVFALDGQMIKTLGGQFVSPDGQLIAMPRSSEGDFVDVWDIVANRKRVVVPGLCEPLAFSLDGKLLAGRDSDEGNAIRFVELDTLTTKAKVKAAGARLLDRLALCADGSILAAQFDTTATSASHLLCWNMATMSSISPYSASATSDATGDRTYFTQWTPGYNSPYLPDSHTISDGLFQLRPSGECRGDYLSPDRRRLLAPHDRTPSPLDWFLDFLSGVLPFARRPEFSVSVVDISSGQRIGEFPATKARNGGAGTFIDVRWSADGNRVAVADSTQQNRWQIWDIPPRKPTVWFATGAALLALPIALIARRRVRTETTPEGSKPLAGG